MSNHPPFRLLVNQALQIELADQTRHSVVVDNFLQNKVVVRFSQLSQIPEGLQPGLPVSLRCPLVNCVRAGKSRIVELCPPPRPGVVLEMPSAFELIQQRRFFRVEVDFPCLLRVLSSAPENTREDAEARVWDISAGGARICTACSLSVGEKVQADFVPQFGLLARARDGSIIRASANKAFAVGSPRPLIGTSPSTAAICSSNISVTARVVRIVPAPNGAPNLLHAGVEFVKLGSSTEDRLVNLVFALQRSQGRR